LPTLNWLRFDGDGSAVPAWPLEDVLDAAAGAGFRDVGLDDLTTAEADPADVAALLRTRGLTCTDVGVLRLGAGDIHTQGDALAALASATGAGICIAALYTGTPDEALADLRNGTEPLAEAGVRAALEFAPYGGLPTLSDAIDVCAAVGWERCGLLLDSWHFFRSGEPWPLLRTLEADQIALVHINDAPEIEGNLVHESRSRRVPPGAGTFPLADFAEALAAIGYDGVVSIEVLSAELRRRPPAVGAQDLFDSLHHVAVGPARTVELN
jgi:sugar phosphate isomerase/epimerase